METSKSFNQEYIEKAKTLIYEILEDKKEYDDWTQICFSMQNAAWLDAYKGSGAFFTMQNMIRFHNCVIIDDNGKTLSKNASLAFLNKKAKLYENREGWRLIGMLKKMLDDNNIDVVAKMKEWRK